LAEEKRNSEAALREATGPCSVKPEDLLGLDRRGMVDKIEELEKEPCLCGHSWF
jgi:hypothetical protein